MCSVVLIQSTRVTGSRADGQISKMAQPQVNVGVASENGCIVHSSAVYPVKDTAVIGYSNIP